MSGNAAGSSPSIEDRMVADAVALVRAESNEDPRRRRRWAREATEPERVVRPHPLGVENYDLSTVSGPAFVAVLCHDTGPTLSAGREADRQTVLDFCRIYRTPGEPHIRVNPSSDEVVCLMKNTNFDAYCCLLVVIMSLRGSSNSNIAPYTDPYSLRYDVQEHASANPTLAGKPKMFIVDAVRPRDELEKDSTPMGKVDIVTCESVNEGRKSTDEPSFFLSTFFEVLKQNDHLHITDVNIELNQRMAHNRRVSKMTDTLRKRLVFGDLRK